MLTKIKELNVLQHLGVCLSLGVLLICLNAGCNKLNQEYEAHKASNDRIGESYQRE